PRPEPPQRGRHAGQATQHEPEREPAAGRRRKPPANPTALETGEQRCGGRPRAYHCRMTRVKVCGVTSLDDARLAVDAGAWAIGMIFHPESPRACDPATRSEEHTSELQSPDHLVSRL